MKRAPGYRRTQRCLLALLLAAPAPAGAQTPATPPAPAPAAPAPAAADSAPAAPAPAAPAAPATPPAPPAPEPAPAVAPATPAAPAAAATPPAVSPTAAPAPQSDVQLLAPDPKLAPAIPLAPPPTALYAEPGAAQPDIALAGSEPAAVASAALLPLLDLRLGFRDQLISDSSYDAFSEDDQLPVFLLAAGVRLHGLESGGALSAVASLELGGSSASLRGLPTELDVLRIGLGPELRLPIAELLYVSGRLSPQAVRVSTGLDQARVAALSFSDAQWTFGLDASVAADLRLAQLRPAGLAQPLGVFLRLEAGYAWSPSLDLELSAANGPVRSAPLPLGELALHGLSLGASIGVGY